jgi:hypothetical protein
VLGCGGGLTQFPLHIQGAVGLQATPLVAMLLALLLCDRGCCHGSSILTLTRAMSLIGGLGGVSFFVVL